MELDRDDWSEYRNSYHSRFCDRFNIGISSAFNAEPLLLDDESQVEGLFLLLDKAYSAGLRRTTRGMPNPVSVIVRRIYGNSNKRAKFLRLIEPGEKTLSKRNLASVVKRVVDLANLLMKVNGGERRPLSFSSKFLHFRIGIFPIWDSIARRGLSRATGRKQVLTYEEYAEAILELLEQAYSKRSFEADEIKRLDNYLLMCGSKP